jgi:hypothetical protein
VGNALALSTYPQAFSHRGIALRVEPHNGVVINCRIGRHDAHLNRQVRIDVVPHTVPSTYAGAVAADV